MDEQDFDQLRERIVETIEDTARWRREKAEEYPEDARNAASATALENAAKYVRGLKGPEDSPSLRALIDMGKVLGDRYAVQPETLVGGGRRLSRFGLDEPVTDYEDVLARIYEDSAEGWAESLKYEDDAPASIVRYLASIVFPGEVTRYVVTPKSVVDVQRDPIVTYRLLAHLGDEQVDEWYESLDEACDAARMVASDGATDIRVLRVTLRLVEDEETIEWRGDSGG